MYKKTMDKHLTMNKHIEKVSRRIELYLDQPINRHSKLDQNLKVRLHKTIKRPTFAYGSEDSIMNENQLKKLKKIQNITLSLRVVYGKCRDQEDD